METVLLAMSGGVDSSVAAHLLLEAGHRVVGVFMRHGEPSATACAAPSKGTAWDLPIVSSRKQGCCSASDAADARRVADRLDIPFYALDLAEDFGRIMDYFVDEYSAGRTPNPCVMCNNWVKFGKLWEYAESVGATHVATGHYAQVIETRNGWQLQRGRDADKDQSYVLFGVQRKLLDRMLLPVGAFHKSEIRDLAMQLGLHVAVKPDSQEICFVETGKHYEFVAERRGAPGVSGEIVTTDGRIVGEHGGIERFTIGQRKGLGVAMGEPYFVVQIDPMKHRVVIGRHEDLACGGLTARWTNWLTPVPAEPFRCQVQIRYNSGPVSATAEVLAGERLRVVLDAPCFGVAPGQAVVCYDGPQVLGGGWIESSVPVP